MGNIFKLGVLLSVLLIPLAALADTVAPPRSYVTPSSDGKYLFVMIASIDIEYDGITSGDEGKKEAKRIRAKYSSSGMYLNNGSAKPLWTVDWYANSVIVSSIGTHIIRRGPWATQMSDEAFTIFEQNKIVRSYKISELAASWALLPQTVSHFTWEESMSLDDEKQTLSVATLSKEKYVFDYLTGRIVSDEKPVIAKVVSAGSSVWVWVVGVIVLFGAGLLFIKRKRLIKMNKSFSILFIISLFLIGGCEGLGFSNRRITVAKEFVITSEPREIKSDELTVTKERQLVGIVLEDGYNDNLSKGIITPGGETARPKIIMIDGKGDEFPLEYDSGLSSEGEKFSLYGYSRGYNTLPIGKKFQKIILQSDVSIKAKRIVWMGWDAKDRK